MTLNSKTLKPGRTSIGVTLEDMNEEARYPLSLEQAATLAWLYNVGHFASDCLQAVGAHLRLALQTVDGASPEELLAAVKSRYWIPGRPLKADSRVQNCFRSSKIAAGCISHFDAYTLTHELVHSHVHASCCHHAGCPEGL